jgi:hypothetical protein
MKVRRQAYEEEAYYNSCIVVYLGDAMRFCRLFNRQVSSLRLGSAKGISNRTGKPISSTSGEVPSARLLPVNFLPLVNLRQ